MLSKNNAIHETALSTAFSVVFACEFIFYASACTQETDAQSSKRKGETERWRERWRQEVTTSSKPSTSFRGLCLAGTTRQITEEQPLQPEPSVRAALCQQKERGGNCAGTIRDPQRGWQNGKQQKNVFGSSEGQKMNLLRMGKWSICHC